jgi:hypothetical protein
MIVKEPRQRGKGKAKVVFRKSDFGKAGALKVGEHGSEEN